MIDRAFWEDVKSVWMVPAPPEIIDITGGSGGAIDPSLLKNPWEMEEIPFDMVDFDNVVPAAFGGGRIPIRPGVVPVAGMGYGAGQTLNVEPVPEPVIIPEPPKPKRPQLDRERFDMFLENQTIQDYVEACKLLLACQLPDAMNEQYIQIIDRMQVLQDAITRFENVYHADMTQFYECYIPEVLELTAEYLEYLNVGVGEHIIKETEDEILDASQKLVQGIKEKIDEIYKFASIEIKAKAKALESLMSMDGYVDAGFKI